MSGHHHLHSYAIQDAALIVAMIPALLLFVIMAGARYFDGLRRARKPLPARPPAVSALASARRFFPAAD